MVQTLSEHPKTFAGTAWKFALSEGSPQIGLREPTLSVFILTTVPELIQADVCDPPKKRFLPQNAPKELFRHIREGFNLNFTMKTRRFPSSLILALEERKDDY